MPPFRPPVEPNVLRWARESMLLSTEEAARRLRVREDALVSWEQGQSRPTLNQLRNAAAVYRQPLSTFLLNTPPPTPRALVAFRTLPDADVGSPSRDFVIGLQRANFQQSIAQHLAELAGQELSPIGLRLTMSMDVDRAGSEIRGWLGVSLSDQLGWRTADDAFRGWSSAVEDKGILIIHVPKVPLSEMRAFAERSRPVPVIALNGKDATTGKCFSLIHELVHILLEVPNSPTVHVLHPTSYLNQSSAAIESFCNKVAAATLMPKDDLLSQPDVSAVRQPATWTDSQIRNLSGRYKVSREALLLRFVSLGKATQAFYEEKRQQYEMEYAQLAQNQDSGGGDYYRLKVRDLGRRFIRTVLAAYRQDEISSRDVTRYLDVQAGHVERIASLVER